MSSSLHPIRSSTPGYVEIHPYRCEKLCEKFQGWLFSNLQVLQGWEHSILRKPWLHLPLTFPLACCCLSPRLSMCLSLDASLLSSLSTSVVLASLLVSRRIEDIDQSLLATSWGDWHLSVWWVQSALRLQLCWSLSSYEWVSQEAVKPSSTASRASFTILRFPPPKRNFSLWITAIISTKLKESQPSLL